MRLYWPLDAEGTRECTCASLTFAMHNFSASQPAFVEPRRWSTFHVRRCDFARFPRGDARCVMAFRLSCENFGLGRGESRRFFLLLNGELGRPIPHSKWRPDGGTEDKKGEKKASALEDDDTKRFFVATGNWVTRSFGSPLPSFLRQPIRFESVHVNTCPTSRKRPNFCRYRVQWR